jgi:hypothetical protein
LIREKTAEVEPAPDIAVQHTTVGAGYVYSRKQRKQGRIDMSTEKTESQIIPSLWRTNRFVYIPKGMKWLIFLLGIAWHGWAQNVVKPLQLNLPPAAMPFAPEHYYISDVIDDRKDKKAVAWLLPESPTTAQATVTQPIDLTGGGLYAIGQFVRQSLPRNTRLKPVVVRLKECMITESVAEKGRVEGRIVIRLSFDLKRDEEIVHLTEYRGGARYNRPSHQLVSVEPTFQKAMVDAFVYLNTWMNRAISRNEKLAKGINVFFDDYNQSTEDGDTLFYNPIRPLAWSDFRATRNRPSKYVASVFPSFSYEGRSEVRNGIIHIYLTTKVFVLRNSSWVKEGEQDAYGLNHEQRHFDIVKVVVERFKRKIRSESLSLKSYNSEIQYEYIESFREMNTLQEQYDGETQHGLDHAAQERWNRRLDEELRKYAVKKD